MLEVHILTHFKKLVKLIILGICYQGLATDHYTFLVQIFRPDYLGEVHCKPIVQQSSLPYSDVKLQWLPVKRLEHHVGDIYAAFELVPYPVTPIDATMTGSRRHYNIPRGIVPELKMYTIEVHIIF